MFTLTTAQGLWMRIFAKRVVKPNHVFSNFFFYFSRKVKALVQRIVHKLNGFFFLGGVVTVLWPLPFYVEGCDIVS